MDFKIDDVVMTNIGIGVVKCISEGHVGVEMKKAFVGNNLNGEISSNRGQFYNARDLIKMYPMKQLCDDLYGKPCDSPPERVRYVANPRTNKN